MSGHINHGGPAFPVPPSRTYNSQQDRYFETPALPGMTLRDWVAVQVLPSIIAAHVAAHGHIMKTQQAEWAYEYADAMMEAREAKAEGRGA